MAQSQGCNPLTCRHAVKKAVWATKDYINGGAGVQGNTLTWNPPPSGLCVVSLWLVLCTIVPLGLLGLIYLLTPIYYVVGVGLIILGLLDTGLPQVMLAASRPCLVHACGSSSC